jgi:RNA polymerase sigma-70 factor (ECF subfamily)
MDTSASLLDRVRSTADPDAWRRFVRLYTPLLYYWARRLGLREPDAADLVQEVLAVLVRKLPEFTYEPGKRFRGWLWTITLNKWREQQRRRDPIPAAGNGQALAHLPDVDPIHELEEAEYRRLLLGRALGIMQTDFAPSTWKACWEHAIEGRPAPEVAAELGLTVGAVYVASSRVLRRLRRELSGLLD